MKQKDDSKIEQIFAATLKLVVDIGVAGITMRQIAKQADMATGTLYIYFKDKETLIARLFRECNQSSINAYFQGYDPAVPFKTGFRVVWDNILTHKMNHFDIAVFLEQCHHSPFLAATSKEISRTLVKPLFKLIERGKEEKMLKDLDTLFLLVYMVGGITDVIKYLKYNNKKITPDVVEAAFNVCWDGLKR